MSVRAPRRARRALDDRREARPLQTEDEEGAQAGDDGQLGEAASRVFREGDAAAGEGRRVAEQVGDLQAQEGGEQERHRAEHDDPLDVGPERGGGGGRWGGRKWGGGGGGPGGRGGGPGEPAGGGGGGRGGKRGENVTVERGAEG